MDIGWMRGGMRTLWGIGKVDVSHAGGIGIWRDGMVVGWCVY